MDLVLGLKNFGKELFYRSGLVKAILRSRHCDLLILAYHKISDTGNSQDYMGISRTVFETHMHFVKNNFKVVSMKDGLDAINRDTASGMYAAINLDDGYMDNYTNAFPVLKKYNIPATVFLATDFVGQSHAFWWDRVFNIVSSPEIETIDVAIGRDTFTYRLGSRPQREAVVKQINFMLLKEDERTIAETITALERKYSYAKPCGRYRMLGWPEIKEMAGSGISFGSHTKAHRNLCLLGDAEIKEELRGSKRAIEENAGIRVSEFCYPFGAFDKRVKNLVMESGFTCARTIIKGVNKKDADTFLLKTVCAESSKSAGSLASRICFV